MILQGHRGTEQRHQAVTGELVDRSVIALHHRGRTVEHRVHDLLEPLRVERRRELHRPDDVGEQHRYLLVFAAGRSWGDLESRRHRRSAPWRAGRYRTARTDRWPH